MKVLLLSAPLSYPLPLLSLTTHLALLSARLPKLVSENEEDPLFNDDWEASNYLYPTNENNISIDRPSITILVMTVVDNIIFDPSMEELAVAESLIAVSLSFPRASDTTQTQSAQILSIRSIDPPSRMTALGIPNSVNSETGAQYGSIEEAIAARESNASQDLWNPPRGGLKRTLMKRLLVEIFGPNGIIHDLKSGLDKVLS